MLGRFSLEGLHAGGMIVKNGGFRKKDSKG